MHDAVSLVYLIFVEEVYTRCDNAAYARFVAVTKIVAKMHHVTRGNML